MKDYNSGGCNFSAGWASVDVMGLIQLDHKVKKIWVSGGLRVKL